MIGYSFGVPLAVRGNGGRTELKRIDNLSTLKFTWIVVTKSECRILRLPESRFNDPKRWFASYLGGQFL